MYLKAVVPQNKIYEFKKCGIWPFDPDVFSVAGVAAESTKQEDDNELLEPHPPSSTVSDTMPNTVVMESILPALPQADIKSFNIPFSHKYTSGYDATFP